MGGHSVHESTNLDVRFHQQCHTRHDGEPAPSHSIPKRAACAVNLTRLTQKQYTYFALTALNRRVPPTVKRTLTSLQIAQFLFGASYAAAHLFVQYDIPVTTPYQVATVVREALSSVSSTASDFSAAVATPSAVAWGPLVKKLLLRAAGEEGVAERVPMPLADHLGGAAAAIPKLEEKIQRFNERTYYETRWRRDWSRVNCIDTSGEAFAIYLNLLYLAPLTFLFGRFFVRAYLQRGKPRTVAGVRESGRQARVETTRAVEWQGEKVEGELVDGVREAEIKAGEIRKQLKEDVRKVREGGFEGVRRARERGVKGAVEVGEKGLKDLEEAVEKVRERGAKGLEEAVEKARAMVVGGDGEGEGERPEKDGEAKDDGGAPSPSLPKGQPSGVESESVERQDEILEGTEELREEEQQEEEKQGEKEELREEDQREEGDEEREKEEQREEGEQREKNEEVISAGDEAGLENKENEAPGLLGHAGRNEMAQTPDDDDDDEEEVNEEEDAGGAAAMAPEDADAMGQSGSLIDLVKEQASEAADEVAAERKKRKNSKKNKKARGGEAGEAGGS